MHKKINLILPSEPMDQEWVTDFGPGELTHNYDGGGDDNFSENYSVEQVDRYYSNLKFHSVWTNCSFTF